LKPRKIHNRKYSERGRALKKYYCIDIEEKLLGTSVELFGWVQIKREHGGVVFVDLRDRTGIVQLVFNEEYNRVCFERAAALKSEFVLQVTGEVRRRENPNPDLPTGDFELWVDQFTVLNTSKTPPIAVVKQDDVSEELRLRYRYIDLRRSRMKENIVMRHRITTSIRKYLNAGGFLDIETPFLTKSTPEGARDFLVPSRLNPGKFYALPQSPQIFKQLLMVAGFEKYYQIVKCFRDEDLRADRQPEFTQVDIEASFIDEEYIYTLIDGMFAAVLKECYGSTLQLPITRLTYDEAIEKYGTDRPDLRIAQKIVDLTGLREKKPKDFIADGLEKGQRMYGIGFPATDAVTRKLLDGFSQNAKTEKVIFSWMKKTAGSLSGPMVKLFSEGLNDILTTHFIEMKDQPSVIVFFVMGERKRALYFLGALRQELAIRRAITDSEMMEYCWITDFPLFEWGEDEDKIVSVHHPFTAPRALEGEDFDALKHRMIEDPYSVTSRSYDLVLNGVELGGGSIRIHNPAVQKTVFSILGLGENDIQKKFGFLIEALAYGAPPHGGIAFGLDRIVMMLQGEDSIRSVIAFPKTTSGLSPLSGAPDSVPPELISELGIRLL
jgi:aspartyl-tRNA synthetase